MMNGEVRNRSGPGVPLGAKFHLNGQLFAMRPDFVADLVCQRIKDLMEGTDDEFFSLDPETLVRENKCDPVKVFGKNEPTLKEKIESGRVRLIMSVSVLDQIIHRLLWEPQHEVEIEHWMDCPPKVGFGFSQDDQCELVFKYFEEMAGGDFTTLANSDIKHWDFTVQFWEMMFLCMMTLLLMGSKPNTVHWKLSWRAFWCITHPIFALPDGRLYIFALFGVMLSGLFETSRGNCLMRWVAARLVGSLDAGVMGDDSIEKFVKDAVEKYKELGHTVKQYSRCAPDHFEFCSTLFYKDKSFFSDGTKSLYHALNQEEMTPELLDQFWQLMRHHPKRDQWMKMLNMVPCGL
jgi:hypothetical protein